MPGTCSVDTSPLLYLYRIGQLTLLRRHYDRVLVPEAVVTELDNGRVEGVDVPDVSDFPWIEIRQIEWQRSDLYPLRWIHLVLVSEK